MEKIAIIENQTTGGGDRYRNNVLNELKKKYEIKIFKPIALEQKSKLFFVKLACYIKYVYFYLPSFYKSTGQQISVDGSIEKIIVFQDAYRKTPDVFQTLKKKSAYILHEPPREFYESLRLHAPTLANKLFTILVRWPIYFSDRRNVSVSSIVISNSKFSKENIFKIYGKKSTVIYPGLTVLSRNKVNRTNQCISVGSLMPYKGHDLVIEAIGAISENRPNLVLVGSGSINDKQRLEAIAAKKRVDLEIISNPTDIRLGDLYKKSHVYVNCAVNEPFGMTSLEALGNGCCLVTVDKCGTEELSSFYPNCVKVAKRSVNDISKKIIESLKKECPPISTNYFFWKRVSDEIIRQLSK